jgi:hypothetical protein
MDDDSAKDKTWKGEQLTEEKKAAIKTNLWRSVKRGLSGLFSNFAVIPDATQPRWPLSILRNQRADGENSPFRCIRRRHAKRRRRYLRVSLGHAPRPSSTSSQLRSRGKSQASRNG